VNPGSQTLIHHFLETSAELYPDKVALIHEDVRATYAEINAPANSLAGSLRDLGINKGDRVVLILHNSLEYVVTYYAILKAGMVAVPLSTDLKPESLKPLLQALEPKAIVTSFRFERLLKATDITTSGIKALILASPKLAWDSNECSIMPFEDMATKDPVTNPEVPIPESSLASIIYTSGSTGEPRGVMLSHENIVSNTQTICSYLELSDKDIQMVVLPFFYVMGKSLLNTHFAVGGTIVVNNKFAFPASVLNDMVAEHVTGFSGVPSTYAYLLHRSPLATYRDKLDTLRYCSQAGGHMSQTIKEQLRKTLPKHTDIYIMYGATEASARLTYLDPESFAGKMNSIGKPIPEVAIGVLDQNGRDLPRGETGELVASGPNIMMGYWRNPEATAKVLDRHGYHTGDLGYADEDGFLFVNGRKDDILKVGGHRINPQEIEDVLISSDMLIEGTVLGIPDDLLGHKLVALGALKNNGLSESDIMVYCAARLPKYKLPAEIKLVKALPKKPTGKIDRIKCRQFFVSNGS